MKRVFVPMTDKNIDKILIGDKTSTLRTTKAAKDIGLNKGEFAVTYFSGKQFLITCLGELTVEEAGGRSQIEKSEAFGAEGPMFQTTKDWLDGKGKLFVYKITRTTCDN